MSLLASAATILASFTPLSASDIPVRSVTLYKHGIAFFERQGVIPAGEEARLDFKTADMNDVLKSLTVTADAGTRITNIRYDANQTLDQRLKRYPFQIGDSELFSTFFDRLKGARVEVKLAGQRETGTILGARGIDTGAEKDKRLVSEQLTLLLDSGEVTNLDLANISSLRLLDLDLEAALKQYLLTVSHARSADTQTVYIDSNARGNRGLRISYIAPSAIWKSSYRLVMDQPNSTLEGWAIVDNTTNEDWENVKLSVVSGRPISFISQLDTPRYGRRVVAELPEDQAAGPVVYGGSVDVQSAAVGSGSNDGFGPGAGVGYGMGRGVYHPGSDRIAKNQAPAPTAGVLEQYATLENSSIPTAAAAAIGELFAYNFAGPVTIRKNQSAMLPFLQDKIAARKLLIYTQNDGEHPVNAAEITNNTAKTLDGGPITVYDCGAYAGEALFETIKAGDKRLIGYAVDYGTRITNAFDSGRKLVRVIHINNGNLELHYGEHSTRTYTIRNIDPNSKNLIIQQEGGGDYSVLSPKPSERTASAYRFEVKVPANSTQSLKVEEERSYLNSTAVSSSTPDFLLTLIENKELDENARRQLRALAEVKSSLAATEASLALAKTQSEDLSQDQTRLRADIDSLNRVKGQEDQVRHYSTQLASNEVDLAKVRDQRHDLELRQSDLNNQLRKAIDALNF